MRKLVVLVCVAGLGYLAYTRLAGPTGPPEEIEYRRIAKAFDAAVSRYGQANRMTNVSGMDVTADIGDIATTVDALNRDLAALDERVTDDELGARIAALADRMERFLSDKR